MPMKSSPLFLFIFYQEALESMDQKACESAKTLNAVLHERKNREQKLVELQSALERMSLVDAVDCSDTPDDQVG